MAKVLKDGVIVLTPDEVKRHTRRTLSEARNTRQLLRLIPNVVLEALLGDMKDGTTGISLQKSDLKAVLKYKQEKGMV